MRQRLSRIKSTAEAKREAALNAMERADIIKITAPDFTVSIRINPPSLVVTSETGSRRNFGNRNLQSSIRRGCLTHFEVAPTHPG